MFPAAAIGPATAAQPDPGPVGERNTCTLRPRGRIAAVSASGRGALIQVGAILATGSTAVVTGTPASSGLFRASPAKARRAELVPEDIDTL